MEWQVVFKQVKASKATEEYVHEKVSRECNKFTLKIIKATVVISASGHDFVAACTVIGAHNLRIHVEGKGSETHGAIDQMVHKLDNSLKKNKDKFRSHSHDSKEVLAGLEQEPASLDDIDSDDVPVDAEDLLSYEEKKKKKKQSA